MASVGGLSSGTSSNLYGAKVKGVTGLASGMDTESMIEGMTYGTRSKIDRLLQDKQKLEWQMDSYRNISSGLIDFNKKFSSISASNSLYRASFFDRGKATPGGRNAKYMDVTGASKMLERMRIKEISQRAEDASLQSTGFASLQKILTGNIDMGKSYITSKLEGQMLTIQYGAETFNVPFNFSDVPESDRGTAAGVAAAFNKALSNITAKDGTKLDTHIKMNAVGGSVKLDNLTAGATLRLRGGTAAALSTLGFPDSDTLGSAGQDITSSGLLGTTTPSASDLSLSQSFADFLGGKTLTFSYNGTTRSIKFPADAAAWTAGGYAQTHAGLKSYLQDQLDSSFGNGRITVNTVSAGGGTGLEFETTDTSSVLKIVNGSSGLLGDKGALNIKAGSSNRINLNGTIEDMVKNLGLNINDFLTGTSLNLDINGVTISGLTKDSTVTDLFKKLSDSGYTVNYLETADKLTVTANQHGAAGTFTIDNNPNNFMNAIFGGASATTATGLDAILKVSYDNGPAVTITRDTNTFDLEGATVTLKGKFTEDPTDPDNDITFSTAIDSEKVLKAVDDMFKAYNDLVAMVRKESGTRHNRDYEPLTEDQRSKMSESQIEAWEKKAKEGTLFNDSILVDLGEKLRFVFSGVADVGELDKMGISVSANYMEFGKITFDQEKFLAALQADPERIQDLFSKSPTGTTDKGGFMARMNSIYDQFAKTTGAYKGSLIEKAGSPDSSVSLLQNTLQKKIDEIDQNVAKLKKKLQQEIDQYSAKFSQLERLVSQMNSQSSALSSFGG